MLWNGSKEEDDLFIATMDIRSCQVYACVHGFHLKMASPALRPRACARDEQRSTTRASVSKFQEDEINFCESAVGMGWTIRTRAIPFLQHVSLGGPRLDPLRSILAFVCLSYRFVHLHDRWPS